MTYFLVSFLLWIETLTLSGRIWLYKSWLLLRMANHRGPEAAKQAQIMQSTADHCSWFNTNMQFLCIWFGLVCLLVPTLPGNGTKNAGWVASACLFSSFLSSFPWSLWPAGHYTPCSWCGLCWSATPVEFNVIHLFTIGLTVNWWSLNSPELLL